MANKRTFENHLLSASVVRLFGRKIEGVTVDKGKLKDSLTNKQLRDELGGTSGELELARIYAFSFENQLHTLPKPTLFLVRGDSIPAKDDTGLANKKDVDFEDGILRWKYDKDDVVLRADIVIGSLDDVLIDATLSPASRYPIISRAATPQEASWRDGQMIARNRFQ